MAREIKLEKLKSLILIEQLSIDIDRVSIDSLIDNGESVIANISFFNSSGLTKSIVLWDGENYTSIGQWTDTDVNKRLLEVI